MIGAIRISALVVGSIAAFSCGQKGDLSENNLNRLIEPDSTQVMNHVDTPEQSIVKKSEFVQIQLKDERKMDRQIDSLLLTVERAITQKEVELLFTVMDEEVISSHGGAMYGLDDFKELWQENDYEKLWMKLGKILSLGGFFVNDSVYSIPYIGNVDEEAGKVDDNVVPYGCGISTKANSRLYLNKECNKNESLQVGRTYFMVEPQGKYFGSVNDLWKVNIIGTDIRGFLRAKDFYCSADYSLTIEKGDNGTWKITAFAPWD